MEDGSNPRKRPLRDLSALRAKQLKKRQPSTFTPSPREEFLAPVPPLLGFKNVPKETAPVEKVVPKLQLPFTATTVKAPKKDKNPFQLLDNLTCNSAGKRQLSRSFSCSDVGRVYDFPVRNGGSFSSDEDEDAEEIDGRRDENDTPLGRAMSSDGDGQDKEHDFMDPLDEILHREESARQDELIDPETPVIPALQIDTEMDRTVVSVLLKKPVALSVPVPLKLSSSSSSRKPSHKSKDHGTDDFDEFDDENGFTQGMTDEEIENGGIDEMQYTSKSFDPPVDWTLKREWTFFSPQSFEWCSASGSLGECQALNGFVQASSGGDSKTNDKMTPKQRFDQSLYHWVYPPTQNPPSHSALMSKILGKAESKPKSLSQSEHADWEFYKEREEEWKVSFRSAYFTVKNGAAPFLYYVNSEFSVLFHYPNESQGQGSNGNSFKAVLSQSTPGLRKALARDGIDFECPTLKDPSKDKRRQFIYQDMDDATRKDVEEMEKRESAAEYINAMDVTTRSLDPLHFNGPLQVHGLYDFLLRWREPRSDRRSQCFPVLYASHPFVNASLRAAKVTRSLSSVQQVVSASASTSGPTPSTTSTTEGFKMTLKGVILPNATGHILSALSLQNPDFTSNSQSLEQTRGVHSAMMGGSQVHRVIACQHGGPYFSRES